MLYFGAAVGGIGARCGVRRVRGQRAQVVSRSARPCGRPHRDGVRRRVRADGDPDRQHDQVGRIRGDVRASSASRQGIVVFALAWFLQRAGRRVQGGTPRRGAGGNSVSLREYTPVEMLRTPAFWVMYVMFVLTAAGGLIATAQLDADRQGLRHRRLPVSMLGLTLLALPFALSMNRVLNGISRPFFGWVSDHLGRENTMFVAFTIEGVGILLLSQFGRESRRVRAAHARSCSSRGARSTASSPPPVPTRTGGASRRRTPDCCTRPRARRRCSCRSAA